MKLKRVGVIALILLLSGLAMVFSSDVRINENLVQKDNLVLQNNTIYGILNKRPLTTAVDDTVTVCSSGCDYTTIQAAVDAMPYFVVNKYWVQVYDGTYDEDVYVHPFIGRFNSTGYNSVKILGNSTSYNGVRIRSVTFDNPSTTNVMLAYVTLYNSSNIYTENAALQVFGGSGRVLIYNSEIECADVQTGVVVYGGKLSVQNLTFTQAADATYNCSEEGIKTKYAASVYVTNTGSFGSVKGKAYHNADGGEIYFNGGTTHTGNNALVSTSRGWVFDYYYGKVWGIRSIQANANVTGTFAVTGATTLQALTATTLDTGQGANELYDMNQNVKTTSDVTFADMTVTNTISPNDIDGGTFIDAIEIQGDDDAEPVLTIVNGTGSSTGISSTWASNNPYIYVVNSGTGISIQVEATGATGYDGAINVNNGNAGSNTGTAIRAYTNVDGTATDELAEFHCNHVAFDEPCVEVYNAGSKNHIDITGDASSIACAEDGFTKNASGIYVCFDGTAYKLNT